MPTYPVNGRPIVIDDGASTLAAVQNTGTVTLLVEPLGRQVAPGATVTVPCWSTRRTRLRTAGQAGAASVTLTAGTPAAGPGPGAVTLDAAAAGTMSVSIVGGAWCSDEGLTTPVTFPRSVTGAAVLYPTAPASVVITATVGGVSKSLGLNVVDGVAERITWTPETPAEAAATAVAFGTGSFATKDGGNAFTGTQDFSLATLIGVTATGGLAKAQNLSDVASPSTALANIGGAPVASPTFTGTPSAPTPAAGNSTTRIATTAWAYGELASVRSTDVFVAVYCVDPTKGNDSNDGLTWTKPKATIQSAINAANTAVKAAVVVLSNDRHDVGSGLAIAKGQPITLTAKYARPLKYASPNAFSAIPAGAGPILYSSTGAASLISYAGNGVAYGGGFHSLNFEMTGAAQKNAIVAQAVNNVLVDDCFFYFDDACPVDSVAIWAYNLNDAVGNDSSWWRITRNQVALGGLVKFGSSTNDTTAVSADANQNYIASNICYGRYLLTSDVTCSPAIEINRGHRNISHGNNIELYYVGTLLRGCWQNHLSGDGGEQVTKFVRLVKSTANHIAPVGSSNGGGISGGKLVTLESDSRANVLILPAASADAMHPELYGALSNAISCDATSKISAQVILSPDRAATHRAPATPVRSGQWGWAPDGGALSTASLANGQLRYSPKFIDIDTTIAAIGIEVALAGSAGAVIRLGVWADDGSGFPTGNPILDAGTVDATTTGFKQITGLTTAVTPGAYHYGAVTQGSPTTPPQVRCVGGVVIGVVPLAGPAGGSNVSGYVDSASVTGALGVPAVSGNVTGAIIATKFA